MHDSGKQMHACMHVHPTFSPSWNGASFHPGARGCMSHAWHEKNIYMKVLRHHVLHEFATGFILNMHACQSIYTCVWIMDACSQHAWLKVCMQKAGHPASSMHWIVSGLTSRQIDIHPVYPCMLWTMLYQASCRWRTLFHLTGSLVTYLLVINLMKGYIYKGNLTSFRPLELILLHPIKKDHLHASMNGGVPTETSPRAFLTWWPPERATTKWKH